MISVPNEICMRRRMRYVVKMRLWIETLCACELSHSKNCEGGDCECARFQHVILPKGCLILLTSCRGAVRWLLDREQPSESNCSLRAKTLESPQTMRCVTKQRF